MINQVYELFAKIGYYHPIHPALTHAPIGGVMVGFFLSVIAVLWRKQGLLTSSYHAMCVAWLLLFPTVLFGILDWQHYYSGAWIVAIQIKMALASLLFILLLLTIIVGRKPNTHPMIMLFLSSLCLINVMALGYFGGQLVYADKSSKNEKHFQVGHQIFMSHCSGCHVNGGNIILPNLPLHSAPQLQSYETFIAFVRNPTLSNGTKGPMPNFTQAKLSDQQAHDLYEYIVNRLAKIKPKQ